MRFQARIGDGLQTVSFNRFRRELGEVRVPELPETTVGFQATDKDIEKKGVLKVADALEQTECLLVTDDNAKWRLDGPEHILDEIVRAYFKRRVEVKGKRMRKTNLVDRIWLDDIESVSNVSDTEDQSSEKSLTEFLF